VLNVAGGISELGWIPANSDPASALTKAGFAAAEITALLAPSS
jgi:hypothetical protein